MTLTRQLYAALGLLVAACAPENDGSQAHHPPSSEAPVNETPLDALGTRHTLIAAADIEEIQDRTVIFLGGDGVEACGLNSERAEHRHTPWSTFKIPNLVIALDSGALDGLDAALPWNSQTRPQQDWWPQTWPQDQTLRSAFQNSAAWAFQDIALKVGDDVYTDYLARFNYGNQTATGDEFWLDRTLKISPLEQVQFLSALLAGELNVSAESISALREVALLDTLGEAKLYGKTGAGAVLENDFDGPFEGWLVGWVERPDSQPFVYALVTVGPSFASISAFRREMSETLLRACQILPGSE